MLNYLFDYLNELDFPGAGLFQYISFRAGMAAFLSLLITITFGRRLISVLRRFQMGESIRDLGLEGQMEKQGTPTMGGIIIISAIVIPTLLLADLKNIYIILLVIAALWMGAIGFLDDYLKVKKKNKEGLRGKFKVIGQIGLGLFVGLVIVFNDNVVIRQFNEAPIVGQSKNEVEIIAYDTLLNQTSKELDVYELSSAIATDTARYKDIKTASTTIPFVKGNEFDYTWLLPDFLDEYAWIPYVMVVIFFVTAISNGANITDGVDGLAAGTCAIIGLALAVLAYLSGNAIFSDYLNIMFIPNSGELVIFCTAFVGACVGFLWYNAFPAQVFMGDTGSLSLGAIIAVLAFVIRKEFLIPILCGILVVENLSVIIQVSYFKYSKKKYGEGKRVFLMSPLHHHYQKKGIHESKIVARFWIVGILLAIFSLATLKIR